ncbi:hypothetical protein GJR96_06700 [Haloferax sp. MBLA0076]|uniref:Uncharacterized protein n=1 Tax=Haloferax litoreum TaxID=2666140 RepID=A0A6A8GE47_9EURY|nr:MULTISPECIES: hypothetical protein [Haloferax]KAB1193149.1 hypothetical protein Hfx1148_06690 [Haloferax sp. CBA1148]MRX21644.1 hypothetical protein [Haloferax litoreum]
MTDLEIFDRFGNPVTGDGPTEDRYERFDRKEVLLYVETTGANPTLVCAFRAHDRPGGRSNRFYATFSGDDVDSLFVACRQAIEEQADELGWRLDTTSDNDRVHTFLALSEVSSDDVALGDQGEYVSHLLRTGRHADFETRDVRTGLAVVKQILQDERLRGSFAVGNNGRVPETDDALVVVTPGATGASPLRPVGATESALESAREEWEERLADDRLAEMTETVTESVSELTQRTSLSDDDLRDRLVREVTRAFERTNVGVQAIRTDRLEELERERDDFRHELSRANSLDTAARSGSHSTRARAALVVVLLLLAFAAGAILTSALGTVPLVDELVTAGSSLLPTDRLSASLFAGPSLLTFATRKTTLSLVATESL